MAMRHALLGSAPLLTALVACTAPLPIEDAASRLDGGRDGGARDGGALDAPLADGGTTLDGGFSDAGADAGRDAGASSAGCGMGGAAGVTTVTTSVDGTPRTYVLSLPAGYDDRRAYPLVFAWHGRNSRRTTPGEALAWRGGAGDPNTTTGGVERAAAGDAVFVYPEGRAVRNPVGWGFDDTTIDGPDYQIFDVILEEVTESYCIDSDRVFSFGHSNGAIMSQAIACRRPGVLRAIAPVAGGAPWMGSTCPTGGEIDVWLHNTRDDDTATFASYGMPARNYWFGRLGCDATSAPVDPSPCIAYEGCSQTFHWCVRETGGHSWPSAATGASIWSFFTES